MYGNPRLTLVLIGLLLLASAACQRGGSNGTQSPGGFALQGGNFNGAPGSGLNLGGGSGSGAGSGTGGSTLSPGSRYGGSNVFRPAPLLGGGFDPSLGDLLGDPTQFGPGLGEVGIEFAMTASTGGGGVSCAPTLGDGLGWRLTEEAKILTNGSTTISTTCLYMRFRMDGFRAQYTITHAGGDGQVYCGASPPAGGWFPKGGGCVRESGGVCISDVCFWEQPVAPGGPLQPVALSHAGADSNTSVDCRNKPPTVPDQEVVSITGVDRVGLLENGGNIWSDLCLWKFLIQL